MHNTRISKSRAIFANETGRRLISFGRGYFSFEYPLSPTPSAHTSLICIIQSYARNILRNLRWKNNGTGRPWLAPLPKHPPYPPKTTSDIGKHVTTVVYLQKIYSVLSVLRWFVFFSHRPDLFASMEKASACGI